MSDKILCIHHHLGLGDHIDCNGLVRYILTNSEYENINLFVKSKYNGMIDYMYADEDRIRLIPLESEENEDGQVFDYVAEHKDKTLLRVGHESYPHGRELIDNKNCWEYFYEQLNISYNVRRENFYMKRDMQEENRVYSKLNPENKPFAFVHDDPDRGYNLDNKYIKNQNLHIIRNDPTENVFHFTKIIEDAEEIHCMESCFKSLIDIYAQTDKIFYHDFRRGNHPLGTRTNKKWNIIKYDKSTNN